MYVEMYVEILHSLVDQMANRLVGNKGQIELLEAPKVSGSPKIAPPTGHHVLKAKPHGIFQI